MRLATWNVNSIKARQQLTQQFLAEYQVDVLAMQEIKTVDDKFPHELFHPYQVVTLGGKTYNGVAIASRLPIIESEKHFPYQPTYEIQGNPALEPRCLRSRIQVDTQEIDVYSLYVPNGREIDHPHYRYKLLWLERLTMVIAQRLQAEPERLLALVGDWNIAFQDHDVWNMEYWKDKTHVSKAERKAFARFQEIGLVEVTRAFYHDYTYWDYQKGRFPNDEGMRIDYAYCSPALAKRVYGAISLREKRFPQPHRQVNLAKETGVLSGSGGTELFSANEVSLSSFPASSHPDLLVPSDHVPIILDIDLGDIST